MVYLLIDKDYQVRQKRLQALRVDIISSPEAEAFDLDVLYSPQLKPDTLRKALIALPVIASQRLVVIKTARKLSAANQEVLWRWLQHEDQGHVVLILEDEAVDGRNTFFKQLRPRAKVFEGRMERKKNVFDMTRLMGQGRTAEALKTLHELIVEGQHPLQLMGGVIWFWRKRRPGLTKETFQAGLDEMRIADLNIKRSRLKAVEALEMLIVQLSARLASGR